MKIGLSHWTVLTMAVLAGITALRMMQPVNSAEAVSVPAAPIALPVGSDTSVPRADSVTFDEAAQGVAAPTF